MTAHDDAVKAAAEALWAATAHALGWDEHMGSLRPPADVELAQAEAAVAAAAPILLAPVQAEVVELWWCEGCAFGFPREFHDADDPESYTCPVCAEAERTRERDEARAEVERLTALVNAKQSWIDGAKVDLASSDDAVAVAENVAICPSCGDEVAPGTLGCDE